MSFSSLGLSRSLVNSIETIGYQDPTPIQEASIPAILRGRDVLACAQTGTGKTASFTLPIVEILQNTKGKHRMPRSIILTPTRELAAQVQKNFNQFAGNSSLKSILLTGGELMASQERLLKKGVDVIIATPGRLLDMYDRGKLILCNVKIVVIDEADKMLDMGFMPDVDQLMSFLSPLRQTLMFSATIAEEIRKISQRYQFNPQEIKITRSAKTAETIDQYVVHTEKMLKREILRQILREQAGKEQAIIFCNRKSDVDILAKSLSGHGFSAQALHGGFAQYQRNETLQAFRDNKYQLLVTSDVTARGIDIDNINLVFNFDVPINEEDYVHRIGRTGRAGNKGKSITLVTKMDLRQLSKIENLTKQKLQELVVAAPVKVVVERAVVEKVEKFVEPRRSSKVEERVDRHSNKAIIGFGDFIPAFMLVDPYAKMRATTQAA